MLLRVGFTAIILGNCFWQQDLKTYLLQYFWLWNYSRNSGSKSGHPPLYRRNWIKSVQLPRIQCYSSQKFGPVCYNAWKGHTNFPLFRIKDESFFFVLAAALKQRIEKVYARGKGEKEDLNHFELLKSSAEYKKKLFQQSANEWAIEEGKPYFLY